MPTYNIEALDQNIIKILDERDKKYEILCARKIMLEKNLSELTQRFDRQIYKKKINDIQDKIVKNERNQLLKYQEEISSLLIIYSKYNENICFGEEEEKMNDEYLELYEKIINIMQKYIPLQEQKISCGKYYCLCGRELTNIKSKNNGFIKCPCGALNHEKPEYVIFNKDKRTDVDSSIENIRKKFINFMGYDTNSVSTIIVDKITQYIEKNISDISPVKIKMLPASERYSKSTNHSVLYKILSRCGLTFYDPHINRIGHLIWGWELPNVAHLEKEFMDIFIKTRNTYRSIKCKDKKLSLGTGYIMYQIFRLLKCNIPKTWFKIVDDIQRLKEHEKYWSMCCDMCGYTFIPYNS